MIGVAIAALGGVGVYLVLTSYGAAPTRSRASGRAAARALGTVTGAGGSGRELGLLTVTGAAMGGLLGIVLFGSLTAGVATAAAGIAAPVSAARARRRLDHELAAQSWPAMLEELRMQTGSLGRSIPVALLDVGQRAPSAPMRAAFAGAARNWHLSNDFPSTVAVLKEGLDSATADAVLETLLVAYEVGGTDLDRRLTSLIDDRSQDLAARRDARSRQAGVRFARWFTIAVPLGMALVGISIGDGRAAYRTTGGQLAIVAAVATTALCWWWASATMRLPETDRVFLR